MNLTVPPTAFLAGKHGPLFRSPASANIRRTSFPSCLHSIRPQEAIQMASVSKTKSGSDYESDHESPWSWSFSGFPCISCPSAFFSLFQLSVYQSLKYLLSIASSMKQAGSTRPPGQPYTFSLCKALIAALLHPEWNAVFHTLLPVHL